MIKIYFCGKCGFEGTRKMLRKHLKEEHFIKTNMVSSKNAQGKKFYRPEWKTKEFK